MKRRNKNFFEQPKRVDHGNYYDCCRGPYWADYGRSGGGGWDYYGSGGPYWNYYDWYDYNRNLILDDNEIEDIVRDSIENNPYIPRLDKSGINVKSKNGVVSLSGQVINRRSKPLAYADAFWSPGVVDVENQIKIRERKT